MTKAGKSLVFERELKGNQRNRIYTRESGDAILVVEVGPTGVKKPFFFVGVFPKALKIEASK